MSEPSTTTFAVTGMVATALGPVLGPWALIVFGAVAGSLLSMSRTPTAGVLDAVKFIVVGVVLACAITGSVAWAAEKYLEIPGYITLVPVAFLIGAARDALATAAQGIVGAVSTFFNRLAGGR